MSAGGIKLNPELVQAVRDAIDLVSLAGEHTQLKRNGNRYKGLCPFHKEKTPSFSVDPDQGLYYCFGCGAGGDAIKLHMELSGDDFAAAIEALANRFGVPLPRAAAPATGAAARDLGGALSAAHTFFQQALGRSEPARRYLQERQIPPPLIERFGIGYAPDSWEALLSALRKNVPVGDLEAAGLIGRSDKSGKHYDRFRHRLMFPIYTTGGRLAGFGGRTLGDDRAKYINTAETAYFHKGNLLYGFHQAKKTLREAGRALLVEGYFDVIGAVAAEIPWAVAGMGTALSVEQARLLSRYVDEVVIAYDGDAAGEKAFERALPLLLEAGLVVRRARFPEGHDPDSLRLAEGAAAVQAAVEAAEDAVWQLLARRIPAAAERTPHEQGKAAIGVVEILRLVRDPLVRQAYAARAAERLGVPEDMLFGRLNPELRRRRPAPADEPGGRREVHSIEEQALSLLLGGGAALAAEQQLPPATVFFDPDCRNIYQAFCALYSEGASRAPTVAEVLSRIDREGAAVDRAARLLLEESVLDDESPSETRTPAENELSEILSKLERRWWKQRHIDLVQQIREALARGDDERVRQLGEEKNALTRRLHPGATGSFF